MFRLFVRPLLAVLLVMLGANAGLAQTSPSLREAVDAAWALNAQARALANRLAELDARARAAGSLLAGPPTLSASYRTDRVGSNHGARESELEVSAPVWNPAVRRATGTQVEAERIALEGQSAVAKLKLAGEVREAAAQATVAQMELELARSRAREAQALAADVERRVRAGESARVDLLQAQSALRQASTAAALAESHLARAVSQWRALTGMSQLPVLEEHPGTVQEHPAVLAARSQLRLAQARLALAEADRRDPLEVGLGMTRERPAAGTSNETSVKLSVRVPLGSYSRNAPRIAAARAEVDAAQAELDAAERAARAEMEAARAELDGARRAEALAAERERDAREIQALIAKSYLLGESDLPTRLRAQAERFEAELAHARTRLETRRAAARLNQSLGLLP
jgi:cobalt-zinc-cadmium efflux system outer membrane protein